MGDERVLSVLSEFVFNERNVFGVFFQHVFRQVERFVWRNASLLGKVDGTIHPVVRLFVGTLVEARYAVEHIVQI